MVEKQSLRGVPWNELKSEIFETWYPSCALKEPVQIDYKIKSKYEYQHSADIFVNNIFNSCHGTRSQSFVL